MVYEKKKNFETLYSHKALNEIIVIACYCVLKYWNCENNIDARPLNRTQKRIYVKKMLKRYDLSKKVQWGRIFVLKGCFMAGENSVYYKHIDLL